MKQTYPLAWLLTWLGTGERVTLFDATRHEVVKGVINGLSRESGVGGGNGWLVTVVTDSGSRVIYTKTH